MTRVRLRPARRVWPSRLAVGDHALYIYTAMMQTAKRPSQATDPQLSLLPDPPAVDGDALLAPSAAEPVVRPLDDPASIHPSLWRASQLARPVGKVVPSLIEALDQELPGRGWAAGSVAELIVKQPGIGELSIVRGALRAVADRGRPIWLVGCPFAPNGVELSRDGLAEHVRWVKTETPLDTQWACETILRSNALGAVIAWLPRARSENIRRLQGLAAATEALVFAVRTPAAANDSSAAPLRLSIEPAPGGMVSVHILKRRGPVAAAPLLLSLQRPAYLDEIRTANAGQSATSQPPIVSNPQIPATAAPRAREKAGEHAT